MTTEQQPTPHETNQSELGGDAEFYANQEPERVEYNHDDIPKITAEQLDVIYNTLYAIGDPEAAEKKLVELLAGYGIDGTKRNNGMLVVELTGVDGKKVVRPIVASAHDFGTVVRNVEMIPQSKDSDEEAIANFRLPDLHDNYGQLSVGDDSAGFDMPLSELSAPVEDTPSEPDEMVPLELNEEDRNDEEVQQANIEYQRVKGEIEEKLDEIMDKFKIELENSAGPSAMVRKKMLEIDERLRSPQLIDGIHEIVKNIIPSIELALSEEAEVAGRMVAAQQQAGEYIAEGRSALSKMELAERDEQFEYILTRKGNAIQDLRFHLRSSDESRQAIYDAARLLQKIINGEYGPDHIPSVCAQVAGNLQDLYGYRLRSENSRRNALEELAR